VHAKRHASRLVVRGRAAQCADNSRVNIALDGHHVLSNRVHGGRVKLGAHVAVSRGTHRLKISVSGAASTCAVPLDVRVSFLR
jgi:hypothetical protein